MKGHIQLGVTGDLRDYLLIDPMQYHASPANPMAPRLNTGEKFAELTGWAEWVQADWPGGVGRSDPNANGYLYGDLDSRVAGQLILPPALGATIGYAVESDFLKKNRGLFMPTDATSYTTVTLVAGGNTDINTYVYGQVGNITTGVGLYLRMSADASIEVRIWDGTAYRTTATLTGTGDPFFAWHWAAWAAPFTLVATGNHAIMVTLNAGTAEVVCGYGYPNYATGTYDGAWTSQTYAPLLVTDWYSTADSIANYTSFLRTPLRLLAVAEKTSPHSLFLASYNVDSDVFGLTTAFTSRATDLTIGSGTTTYNGTLQLIDTKTIDVADGAILKITDQLTSIAITSEAMYQGTPAVQFDAHTYIPVGDGFGKIDADGNGTTETPDASLFTAWAGYLWRATGNDLYYSADGSTWTGPIAIGGDDYRVRGLAGLERTVYAATDEGLFYVGDGDITIGITPWGTLTNEELRAINYEGAILVPVAGRVLRYSADGTMIDVWVQRADDLPADKLGAPALLAAMNQWLLAAINPGTAGGSATCWAWQVEGWHPIFSLPPGINVKSLYYDRTLSRLWAGCDHGLAFHWHIDDYAISPINSPDSRYMPYGWMETPKFYGDLKKIDKDFESVFITGDFPAGTTASIYYQSDQNATWTILGTASGDNTELRWSNYTTRPTGKWIKLGLLLATTDPTASPKVTALVVKYIPMIFDREKWTLPIIVGQEQEMLDGTQDVQTQAQKLANLRSLITRVAPFTFVDLDGTQYECKVVGAARS
ncbi:MAG: hypothetical protein KAX65_01285, partial [Caldilineaceae bacterium]|nr:hypothetical protein [Caldilineaceae bacterium]